MSRDDWQALALLIYVLVILPVSLIAIVVFVILNWYTYLAILAMCTFIGMLFTGEFFPPYHHAEGGAPGR